LIRRAAFDAVISICVRLRYADIVADADAYASDAAACATMLNMLRRCCLPLLLPCFCHAYADAVAAIHAFSCYCCRYYAKMPLRDAAATLLRADTP